MNDYEAISDTVLLPHEAAELLQISEPELLAAAGRRAIPGVCLGGVWRFSRRRILSKQEIKAS
ncbi:hypothetical protein REH65_33205 (plasmid) [Saccharopolyspora sp. ID03-671]|uniref:hypothetical protein n=1 Tax=Saccharopolyspora sp. ID03-671 TaxID=3073066 RepID=UPI0030F432FC